MGDGASPDAIALTPAAPTVANGRVTVIPERPHGPDWDANRETNLGLVAELRERLARVQAGGGAEAVERHRGARASTGSSNPARRSSR